MSNTKKFKRNMLSNIFHVLFLFVHYLDTINTDIPVHCVQKDVVGYWNLRISKKAFNPSLKNEITTCGHGFPNKIVNLTDDSDLDDISDYSELTLELRNDYKVYQNFVLVGKWTFVYDQSFIIYYKESVFTAPFKYYKSSKNDKVKSNCSKTFKGWSIPDVNYVKANWSCFYSFKTSQATPFNFLEISLENQTVDQYIEQNINIPTKENNLVQTHMTTKVENHLKYEQMNKIIERMNKLDLGWEADLNKEYVGLTFLDLKNKIGLGKGNYKQKDLSENTLFIQMKNQKKNLKSKEEVMDFLSSVEKDLDELETNKKTKKKNIFNKISKKNINKNILNKDENCCVPLNDTPLLNQTVYDKDSNEVFDFNEATKFIITELRDIDENKISRNWDWRNVGGINYISPIQEQGGCGSCYVFSTLASLESRLRIQTNNTDKTVFSRQFPISCNFYSEGCHGGYPVLVSKFFNEFEIVPEDCFKYTQTNNKCENVCDYSQNKKKYTVSKYGYLGGFYGGTSEADMMKEIRARGPIPGNIKVHWSFHYYKKGIFSKNSLKFNNKSISKKRLIDGKNNWAEVNHSITLVGYGEENGIKYWIGMNTWGENWGEKGFFKILRGENESEIETMGDYMNIKVENRIK